MTRALDVVQAERVARTHIAPITFVKLTTFLNNFSRDVDQIFYLSNMTALYDYGNTGTDQTFLPVITGGGEFVSKTSHLPSANDTSSAERFLDVRFSNLKINGFRFVTILQEFNLEGAAIEVAQLLILRSEMEGLRTGLVDLSSYVGNEHTVLFRGRVNRVAPIEQFGFTLECRSDLPTMSREWIYVSQVTRARAIDVGVRLPRIYGKAVHTPAVSWIAGPTAILLEDLTDTQIGNILVSDAPAFPHGDSVELPDHIILMGEEQIKYRRYGIFQTNNTKLSFSTGARGVNGTTAVAHKIGESFQLLRGDQISVINDRESEAVPTVYEQHPDTGLLIPIDESLGPVNKLLKDQKTVPGRTVTSMNFSTFGTYEQQPNSITGGLVNHQINAMDRQKTATDSTFLALTLNGQTCVATFQNLGTFTKQTIRVWLTKGGGDLDVEIKVGTVVIGTILAASIPASGSVPAEFSFVTVSELGNVSSVDPVSTGGVRVHNIERIIDIVVEEEFQTADSCNTNIAGANEADLRDQDLGTFVAFTLTDNEFVECTFAEPGIVYTSQRIRIKGKIDPDPSWSLQVDGSSHFTGISEPKPVAVETYEWQTDKIGNTIRMNTTTSEDLGEIYEIERTVFRELPTQALAKTSKLFADVDGVLSPGTPVETYAQGESFDAGTWNVDKGSVAADTVDKAEGVAAQRIDVDAPPQAFQTDSLTEWSQQFGDLSIVTDEGHLEGTGAIKIVTNSTTVTTSFQWRAGATFDLSDTGDGPGILAFDVKFRHGNTRGYMTVTIGSSASDALKFFFDSIDFESDVWYTVFLDPADVDRVFGSTDLALMDRWTWIFNENEPQSTGGVMIIDNARVLRDRTVVIQNNAIGGNDLSGPSDDYRITLRGDGGELIEQAVPIVYISDDVGTGTTLTPSWRRINFEPHMKGEFAPIKSDSILDMDSPVLTNIRTVRFEVTISAVDPLKRIRPRLTPLAEKIWVDNLEIALTLGTAYKAAAGVVMSHPTDIIRHWIEEVGGETLQTAGFDDLFTALGSLAEWGFDARGMGISWESVLLRMAFEARCNIVAVETSAGREWKILVADNNYGWGQATDEIVPTDEVIDQGRGVDDLATFFNFYYSFDASLGDGSNQAAYKDLIIASPLFSEIEITKTIIGNAAKRAGEIVADPVTLVAIQDANTALDVAGYQVQERIANDRRVFSLLGVPWYEALPHDVGDLVRIVPPWRNLGAEIQLFDLDSDAVNWSAEGGTPSDESTTVFEGTGALKILALVATAINAASSTDFDPVSLLGRAISIQAHIPTGDLALITEVGIRISSTAGGATNFYEFSAPVAELIENTYQRIEFRIHASEASATNGTPDLRRIVNLWLRFTLATPDGTSFVLFDDARVVNPSTNCRILSMSKAFTEATWDIVASEAPAFGSRSAT